MNNKITTGIWLVFIGIVILLHNTNVIDFNFYAIMKYWPLAIVSVGVALLLQNRPYGAMISIVCNILICSFLVFKGSTSPYSRQSSQGQNERAAKFGSDSQSVHVDLDGSTETVKLKLNGGAAAFSLVDSADSSKMFQAWTNNQNIDLKLKSSGDETKKITLDTDIKGSNNKNSISFFMHRTPIWELDLNLGAATFSADLSPYKIKSLEVNSGASAIDMVLGYPQLGTSTIDINTGASSVEIKLPDGAPYEIISKNILSSISHQGARKTRNGHYETDNYQTASDKFIIQINGAANAISVKTYTMKDSI